MTVPSDVPSNVPPIVPLVPNSVVVGDARKLAIPPSSIDMVIFSPPYNVGTEYREYDDWLTEESYEELLWDVIHESHRVLKIGGRMAINVANVGRKPYIPRNVQIANLATFDGLFLMRGEIIWDKEASVGGSTAWGSWQSASNPTLRDTHEYILVFSKGEYRKGTEGKGTVAGTVAGTVGGISTISRDSFLECTKSIWRFPTESAKKVGHPSPFPVELPYRLIQLYTYASDVVLDPMCGSGSTMIAAKKSGRKWIGVDIDPEYVEISKRRLEE